MEKSHTLRQKIHFLFTYCKYYSNFNTQKTSLIKNMYIFTKIVLIYIKKIHKTQISKNFHQTNSKINQNLFHTHSKHISHQKFHKYFISRTKQISNTHPLESQMKKTSFHRHDRTINPHRPSTNSNLQKSQHPRLPTHPHPQNGIELKTVPLSDREKAW